MKLFSQRKSLSKVRRLLPVIVKRLILIFVPSLFFGLLTTFVVQYVESTQIEQLTFTTTITISNETTFSSPFEAFVKQGAFDSVGKVYAYMSSPYANYWNIFNIWMSLNNNYSWTKVPFLTSDTSNITQMAYLGSINFADPQLKIYVKSYIPPQTIFLPPNVTKEEASALKANVLIKKEATPQDTTKWFLTFSALFSTVLAVITAIFTVYYDVKKSKPTSRRRKKTKA